MAGGEFSDLWAARIQEQLEGLARAGASLDTSIPVPVTVEADGDERVIGRMFSSGEAIHIQFHQVIDLEK